jgi:hypothetical protein
LPVGIFYVNDNLSAAGENGSVGHGGVINIEELLTESTVNTVDCRRGLTDSHGIVVAGILALDNCGAGSGFVTETSGRRRRTSDIIRTRTTREVDYRVRALSEQW